MFVTRKIKQNDTKRNTKNADKKANETKFTRNSLRQSVSDELLVPVIEITLYNLTKYQKQRLFSFNCKCLQKSNHLVSLKEKKAD